MAPAALGFKNLVTAPEDDGLDEEVEESREVVDSEEEDEDSEEVEEVEEGGSGSGSEDVGIEEGEFSGDEDGLALDELEDVELHPDAVPRRGVKVIDNKVWEV